jgi:OOP family OmpA-OmpF porin
VDDRSTLEEPKEEQGSEHSFAELRNLLLGDQIRALEELRRRVEDPNLRALETSKILAEALSLSIQRDRRVQSVLQPVVEESVRISVEKNPNLLFNALFPIIGKVVRKSVTHALQQMLDSLNSILADGLSFKRWRWRIEAIRSGKSFGEIALARSLVYRVEQVYLIHRKTGILLAESSKHPGLLGDADLVVGMLTALQDFVRDSFTTNQQDDLEVLHIGEFKVWLLHGPLAILALVVRGQLPEALQARFSDKIEQIHQDFHSQLVSFEMDGKPIIGINAGLDDCLLGEATSERPSYIWFKVASGITATTVLFILFFQIRAEVRWQNYLGALRQHPGIVVVEAHRGWNKFSLIGLRDPIAVEPRSLLAAYHLSEKKVSEDWEEYLSLDPRLSNARRLDAEAVALSKEVIRFEVNTAKIPLEQLPLVDTISDQIRQLALTAASQGKELRVKISGEADSTGTEDRNAELSRERAEMMVRLLVARGVEPKILSAVGLGDKLPGSPGADSYEQNLDRRVTFTVLLDGKEMKRGPSIDMSLYR